MINWLYLTIFLMSNVILSNHLHWEIITATSLTKSLGKGHTQHFEFAVETTLTNDIVRRRYN